MKRNLTDAEEKEVIDWIKQRTGAVGLCLIISDSMLPCPDALSGEKCAHPHRYNVLVEGIHPMSAMECIAGCTNKSLLEVAEEIIEYNNDQEDSD